MFPLFSQQTVTEKYEFVRSSLSLFFLRFVSDLPTPELKCHPRAIRCQSACFHYSGNNTLAACQPTQNIEPPDLFICGGGGGQANAAASELELLYLSPGPNVCFACAVVLSVKGSYFLSARARNTHKKPKKKNQFTCGRDCLCVSVGTYACYRGHCTVWRLHVDK